MPRIHQYREDLVSSIESNSLVVVWYRDFVCSGLLRVVISSLFTAIVDPQRTCEICAFILRHVLAEVQVIITQDGVGVPIFLNEPWSMSDQRIVVNVTEGRYGHILTLIAVDSITNEPITLFRERAGDPDNYFTVDDNGMSSHQALFLY